MRTTTYNRINLLLIKVLVVFIFFDGIRSNLIIGDKISYLRELTIFLIIFFTFSNSGIRKIIKIPTSIVFFIFYHIIICLISLLEPEYVSAIFILKPFEFIGLYCVFYSFEDLTGKSNENLYNYIIKIAVIFCIINVLLYFANLQIWVRDVLWWGRISCGYPTMDVVSLGYALTILLYYPNLHYSTKTQVFYILIILLGIILNFSGTGFVILTVIFFFSILSFKRNKNRKPLLISFIISFSLFLSVFSFVVTLFPEEYESGKFLIENKWETLKGDEVSSGDNTIEIREEQYAAVEKRHNMLTRISGLGIVHMTMDRDWNILEKDKMAYSIENQYSMLLMGYGIIGLFLYLFIFIDLFMLILKKLKKNVMLFFMYTICIIIALCNSYTLILLMLYSNFAFLALIFSNTVRDSLVCMADEEL